MNANQDLTGKVALVTGAATGIGRATALRLASEGVNIAVNYSRSQAEAEQTQRDLRSIGVHSILCRADVSDDHLVRQMVREVLDSLGRIDILVNNAGTTDYVAMEDLDGLRDEHWNRVMDVNVKGLFNCCRASAAELRKRKGCIINVTSVGGITGQGSSIAYAASKAAAISVTRSLARVLAPEVRVNSVAPGIVMTRWVEGHEDHVVRFAQNAPLGRASNPEDVADLVYALVNHASMVTGRNIVIDGGMFI